MLGPTGPRLDTPLAMQFWSGCRSNGIERLLVMDNAKARSYAALVPQHDQILALANSSLYGGAGGSYATASADNASAKGRNANRRRTGALNTACRTARSAPFPRSRAPAPAKSVHRATAVCP